MRGKKWFNCSENWCPARLGIKDQFVVLVLKIDWYEFRYRLFFIHKSKIREFLNFGRNLVLLLVLVVLEAIVNVGSTVRYPLSPTVAD